MIAAGGNAGFAAALIFLTVAGTSAPRPLAGDPESARVIPILDPSTVEEIGAPLVPVAIRPLDGATRVSREPELRVRVTDPEHQPLDVTFRARARVAPAAPFTILHWTDTQFYAQDRPEIFDAVTQWMHDHAIERNIVFAPMSGDIVDDADQPVQWARADVAIRRLEAAFTGHRDGVAFGVLPGNHDQFPREHADSTRAYNQVFGVSRFEGRTYYGGSFDGIANDHNFALFEGGGMSFIAVFIGFDPDADPAVLTWADSLLTVHADRRALVVSHYLVGLGDQAPFGEQGAAIYDALKHHRNLFLMLAGDQHGEGRRVDVYDGNPVHTLVANYQTRPEGGQGWIRLLEFRPEDDEIRVSTYSPWLDRNETDADSEFVIPYDLDPHPPFTVLGTVHGVESGTDATWTWPELDPNVSYEWMVTVTDGCHVTPSPVWSFTTEREITFSAYNDLAWGSGQMEAGITRITSPAGGSGLPSTGELIDHPTGASTGITLAVTGGTFDGDGHGELGAEPPDTSDAHATFGGRVSCRGQISFVDEAGSPLTLTMAGMDSSRVYDLVFHAHRDDYGWDEASIVTLSGQRAFANRSSTGLDDHGLPLFEGPADPSTRIPADNDTGWVASYADVEPGEDGAVVLTIDFDGSPGSEYRGKYAGALFVREFSSHGNRPPLVFDPGDREDDEGDTVAVHVVAADPDSDAFVFDASGLPPGIAIDPGFGVLAGVLSEGAAAGSPYVVNVSATDTAGASGWTGFLWWVESECERGIPEAGLRAGPARPNPFRPVIRIPLRLDSATAVSICIYDVAGRLVRRLLDDELPAGEHAIAWDGRTGTGRSVSAGVYFFTVDADRRRVASERVVRIR